MLIYDNKLNRIYKIRRQFVTRYQMWVKSICNAIVSIIEVQHGGKRDIKCKTIDTPHRQRQHLMKFYCFNIIVNTQYSNITITMRSSYMFTS